MTDLSITKAPQSSIVEIESSRAIQEVQASLVIAKKFPRDLNAVYTRIISSCQRYKLAAKSIYTYPRGGATVTGPSIRLAEVLAQNYGNISFGVRELERHDDYSLAESYCWDLETNTKQSKVFEIAHEIVLKTGHVKKLKDPRDIYEIVANNGARRLRACILGIIPSDIIEAAEEQCRETIAKGPGKFTLAERVQKALVQFKEVGVTKEMLEARMGHSVDTVVSAEYVEWIGIYTSIKDGSGKASDFFESSKSEEVVSTSGLGDKLKAKVAKREVETIVGG